nr:hypothetical protein [Tanacetum cinerariifolium]
MDQIIDSSGSDQIQTPQYPDIHHPSQEISEEVFQDKGDLMKSIQTFLEEFNYISFGEKPKILLQAWDEFFAIQHAQPEDSNELFQKLLEDLHIINKELTECNHPTFFNDNENNFVQYKEYLENSSKEIATSNSNQKKEKPPQDFDIQLVEVCRQKELYCMHDNVDNLIERALNSKLLSINLESQHLDKKKHEVKNVVEQPIERGTHIAKSFQNFRVIHKNSTSLKNTSQISLVHAIAPILPNEEPYEYEVTSDDESKCEVPIKGDYSSAFTTFSNPLFNDNDDFTSSDDESLPDEDVLIEEFKFDFLEVFSGALLPTSVADEERIRREHAEYIILMERLITINPCPRPMVNSNTIVESLPLSLIPVKDNDSQREEINIVTDMDELLPPGFENDDSEGEIDVFEELRVDNSIPSSENELSDFDHDDSSFLRPPLEPPDVEFDFELNSGEVISTIMNDNDDDECFDPGEEFNVFANDEDDDYFAFMFFIRIFLPYLIYP